MVDIALDFNDLRRRYLAGEHIDDATMAEVTRQFRAGRKSAGEAAAAKPSKRSAALPSVDSDNLLDSL